MTVLTLNRKGSLLKREAWSNFETSFNIVWSQDQCPGYSLQACLQVAVKIKCEIWKAPCLLKHNIQPSYKPCKLLSLWRVFVLRIFTTRQISPVSSVANAGEITGSFYTIYIYVQNVSTSYNKDIITSAHLYLYNCRPGTESYLFTIYNDTIISLILSYKHKRNCLLSDNWDNQPLPAISSFYWRQRDFFNGIILMSVCLNTHFITLC